MSSPESILQQLPIRIFADGADRAGMLRLNDHSLISGLTTNPTLMRKAGISDYEAFARDILGSIRQKPISFEVFSDDFDEMKCQARKIASWGENVYVKIPITNTKGESSAAVVRELSAAGVRLNVTALLTTRQVEETVEALDPNVPAVISVFAGRIADTGSDPEPIMRSAVEISAVRPKAELLWASVREVFNIFQAARCGCHIVTVPHDILTKALSMAGTNHQALSLDTVKMFATDAQAAGFTV